jgi:mono/diheme cytochrome c family protein
MLLLAAGGCTDERIVGDDGSPSNVVFPASGVSYQEQVQVLFSQACNFSGCHGSDAPVNMVKLTSWGDIMTTGAGVGVVIPGEPQNSTLVFRIEGRGARMPPAGLPLNQNQINGIRAWIVEGAKNN